MSVDRKKVTKNAYRITKVRGKTALRVRVPGGHLKAEYLGMVQDIADRFGNGTVHLTARQGFEVPGVDFDRIPEINKIIRPMIESLNLDIEVTDDGYPAAALEIFLHASATMSVPLPMTTQRHWPSG